MRKNDLQALLTSVDNVSYLSTVGAYRKRFLTDHKKFKSWRKVAEPFGLCANMARLISMGYIPGSKIRAKLNLPAHKPAPVCPSCGVVHVAKRCPKRKRKYRDLFSIPVIELTTMLKNRKEF